jgi:hypothetical protein
VNREDQKRSEEYVGKAKHHASEAERLLEAAGRPVFQFQSPMVNTREDALLRAGVHASLANYYATGAER